MNTRTIDDLREQLAAAYDQTPEVTSAELHAAKTSVLERRVRPHVRGTRSHLTTVRSRGLRTSAWVAAVAAGVLVVALIVPSVVNHASSRVRPSKGTDAWSTLLELTPGRKIVEISGGTGEVRRTFPWRLTDVFTDLSVTETGEVAYAGNRLSIDPGFDPEYAPIEQIPLDGGKPSVLPISGTYPSISPDGTELAYAPVGDQDDIKIWDVDDKSSRTFSIANKTETQIHVDGLAWYSTSELIVSVSAERVFQCPEDDSCPSVSTQIQNVDLLNVAPENGSQGPSILGWPVPSNNWSNGAPVPGSSGDVAIELPDPRYKANSRARQIIGENNEIAILDPDNPERLLTQILPSLERRGAATEFTFTQFTLDTSGHAYVIGGFECQSCEGSTRNARWLMRLYRLSPGTTVPQLISNGAVIAIAWLPGT
jgi:hypothetical protein